MDLLMQALSVIAHLDQHLVAMAQQYGAWIYVILFLIIFCETGLVVTPFLPGDSLLFVAGAVAAMAVLDVHVLVVVLTIAAFLGNVTNYKIGGWLGERLLRGGDRWFFRREHLDRTREFYRLHGGKTVVASRFLPILRTYAPFVAGMSRMPQGIYMFYTLVGALLWVASLTYAGFFFGNIPVIKQNLTLLVIGIVVVSLLPALIGYLRSRRAG